MVDTHAVIWHLADDPRLSERAAKFMDDAAKAGQQIAVSAVTFVEIVYLMERGRLGSTTLQQLLAALDSPGALLAEVPFDRRIAETVPRVERSAVPDMPDRIIAASALFLGVPLISRDAKIQLSGVEAIW